jgi:hypothetical protein
MVDATQSAIEQAALQALVHGRLADAVHLIAQSDGESPGSPRLGRTGSLGLPPNLVDTASYLLTLPYADLPYPGELRQLVRAQLALGVLLWERPDAIALRLLQLTDGQFTCPSLEAFLRHHPPGRLWFHFNPHRPQDRAALYAQTRCVEAAAAVRLKRLLENRTRLQHEIGCRGIEVLYAAGHQCEVCLESKRQYRWSEIDGLPTLPRHWGCRCMYMAWSEMLG